MPKPQVVPADAVAPVLRYEGRVFDGTEADFEDLGARHGPLTLGGNGFTVAFTARWDSLNKWSRILDFGNGPGGANIFVANKGHAGTLAFHIFVDKVEHRAYAHEAIKLGQTRRYMCSVTPAGRMKIFMNGLLLSENEDGAPPPQLERRTLLIAKSSWDRDAPFHGQISDVAVWDAAVNWDGTPVEEAPPAAPQPLPPLPIITGAPAEPGPELEAAAALAAPVVLAADAVPPVLRYEGRQFSGKAADFEDLSSEFGALQLGGPLSIAFTARFDAIQRWCHLVDFNNGPEEGNVFVANKASTGTLAFHIWLKEREIKCQVPNMFAARETSRFLCTVGASGRMRVYKDGLLVGENRRGAPPPPGPRQHLYVAKSPWGRDTPYCGAVRDLIVWNAVVGWDGRAVEEEFDAFSGRVFLVDLATLDRQFERFEGKEWLTNRIDENLPISWDVQLAPDGGIALMSFASEDTVLMLRTHRTGMYLPTCVIRVLLNTGIRKAVSDTDGRKIKAIRDCFDFEPSNVVALDALAETKGVEARGLRSLLRHFNFKVREEHQELPSADWDCRRGLSDEDATWAANQAFFVYATYQELDGMWNKDEPRPARVSKAAAVEEEEPPPPLVLEKEWEAHGVELRDDGFWCTACNKGPLKTGALVETHLTSAKHLQRLDQQIDEIQEGTPTIFRAGRLAAMPAKYEARGILPTQAPVGFENRSWYMCSLCNAGPFNTIEVIDRHLEARKHRKMELANAPEEEQKQAAEQFNAIRWNLPKYVKEDKQGLLACSLCDAKAGCWKSICAHLTGERHARRCRSGGWRELSFSKERDRLEDKATGDPIIRPGHTPPPGKGEPGPRHRAAQEEDEGPPLPEGWEEAFDEAQGAYYYYNVHTNQVQWEVPTEPGGEEAGSPEPVGTQQDGADEASDAAGDVSPAPRRGRQPSSSTRPRATTPPRSMGASLRSWARARSPTPSRRARPPPCWRRPTPCPARTTPRSRRATTPTTRRRRTRSAGGPLATPRRTTVRRSRSRGRRLGPVATTGWRRRRLPARASGRSRQRAACPCPKVGEARWTRRAGELCLSRAC